MGVFFVVFFLKRQRRRQMVAAWWRRKNEEKVAKLKRCEIKAAAAEATWPTNHSQQHNAVVKPAGYCRIFVLYLAPPPCRRPLLTQSGKSCDVARKRHFLSPSRRMFNISCLPREITGILKGLKYLRCKGAFHCFSVAVTGTRSLKGPDRHFRQEPPRQDKKKKKARQATKKYQAKQLGLCQERLGDYSRSHYWGTTPNELRGLKFHAAERVPTNTFSRTFDVECRRAAAARDAPWIFLGTTAARWSVRAINRQWRRNGSLQMSPAEF